MKIILTDIPFCSVFAVRLRQPVTVKLWKMPLSKMIDSIEIHREEKNGQTVYFAYGFYNGENVVPPGYGHFDGRESNTGNNLAPGDLFQAVDNQLTERQVDAIEAFLPEFSTHYRSWSTFKK
jgi:hypothetical protein